MFGETFIKFLSNMRYQDLEEFSRVASGSAHLKYFYALNTHVLSILGTLLGCYQNCLNPGKRESLFIGLFLTLYTGQGVSAAKATAYSKPMPSTP